MSMILASVVLAATLSHGSVESRVEAEAKPLSEEAFIVAMFDEMNRRRVEAGLPEMVLDEDLCVISQRWSNYMARTGAFHHGGGENVIAMGQSSPKEAIRSWMNSAGHRAFLMGRSRKVGFGAQRDSRGRWYWSGTFR